MINPGTRFRLTCSRVIEIQSRGDVQECTKPQTEDIQRCIANTRPHKITHPAALLIYVTARI